RRAPTPTVPRLPVPQAPPPADPGRVVAARDGERRAGLPIAQEPVEPRADPGVALRPAEVAGHRRIAEQRPEQVEVVLADRTEADHRLVAGFGTGGRLHRPIIARPRTNETPRRGPRGE